MRSALKKKLGYAQTFNQLTGVLSLLPAPSPKSNTATGVTNTTPINSTVLCDRFF